MIVEVHKLVLIEDVLAKFFQASVFVRIGLVKGVLKLLFADFYIQTFTETFHFFDGQIFGIVHVSILELCFQKAKNKKYNKI